MRYVALGDSLTAGIDETPPGTRWPDLLAEALGAARAKPIAYENLAVFGQESAAVRTTQLAAALAQPLDLASVTCGGNDVMKQTRPDVDGYADCMDVILDALRRANPDAVLLTAQLVDVSTLLPYRERSRARIRRATAACNDCLEAVAARYDVRVIPLAAGGWTQATGYIASDGLHPSIAGHREIFTVAHRIVGDLLAPSGEPPAPR